ncbi:MAG TPA: Arc family DNA-binding protein [Terriglobales bacterium]|jgi:plasmid stability protein
MATVTLKGVPERVQAHWKARAKRNGRSLNQEIIQTLQCLTPANVSARKEARLMASVRALREELAAKGIRTTPDEVEEFIQAGRK